MVWLSLHRLPLVLFCLIMPLIALGGAPPARTAPPRGISTGSWHKGASGTSLNLYGVSFATHTIGVSVGAYGVIRRSTTGGSSWSAVGSPTASTLNSVALSPSGLGWAAGVSNILKTTDYGAHWGKRWLAGPDTTLYDTVDNFLVLNTVSFPTDTVGYAGGFYADIEGTIPILFKSTDAGETWQDVVLPFQDTTYDQQMLLGLYFLDPATGFLGLISMVDTVIDDTSMIFTLNQIFKTSDGGTTWTVNLPDTLEDDVADFIFTSSTKGYAAGSGSTLKTTTGGAIVPTWIVNTHVPGSLNAITSDGTLLFAVGPGGNIISSTNGNQWNTEVSGVTAVLWDVTSRLGTTCAVGSGGVVLLRDSTLGGTIELDIQTQAFWNVVSRPLVMDDSSLTALFPFPISHAFSFSPGSGYQQTDTLDRIDGYWVKFATDQSVAWNGYPITSGAFPVSEGWNLIGSLTYPVPVDSIVMDPPGMSSGNFFGYNNGYAITDTIVPGKGYWVKVSQDGMLLLTAPGYGLEGRTGGATAGYLNRCRREAEQKIVQKVLPLRMMH